MAARARVRLYRPEELLSLLNAKKRSKPSDIALYASIVATPVRDFFYESSIPTGLKASVLGSVSSIYRGTDDIFHVDVLVARIGFQSLDGSRVEFQIKGFVRMVVEPNTIAEVSAEAMLDSIQMRLANPNDRRWTAVEFHGNVKIHKATNSLEIYPQERVRWGVGGGS